VKEFGLTGPAAIQMDFERGPALACAASAAVTPDAFTGMAQRGNVARSHKLSEGEGYLMVTETTWQRIAIFRSLPARALFCTDAFYQQPAVADQK